MQPKNRPFKNISKYFFGKQYLGLLIALFLTLIIANGVNLATPQIASKYIDSYTTSTPFPINIYLLLGVLVIFVAIFSTLQTYLTSLIGEKIAQDLRKRLYEKVLNQEYEYLYKTKPSKILTIMLSDVNNVKGSFVQTLIAAITSIFMIIGSAILMFSINGKIALLIVLTVPTIIVILFLLLKDKFKIFKFLQKARDSLNKVINENIKGAMLIRVFVAEKTEEKKFAKVNKKYRTLGERVVNIFAIVIPTINAIILMGTLIVIYFGGKQAIGDNLTYGQISALTNYVSLFTFPILIIGFIGAAIGQAIASLNRINEVLDSPITFINGAKDITDIKKIEVKNLQYKDEDQTILRDINFKLTKGQKVGIIGLTGSGKTSFLKQIIRALDPTEGEVLINGIDLKEYDITKLRKLIGFTFQENFLINDTIRNNILFGNTITKKELDIILKISNVDEIVKKLPNGLESKVGEEGSKLSGGQKQRIMIARALALKPKLLILDDSTSRLDISTEKIIFDNISKQYPEISIITVSQKIYSLVSCDNIYVMEDNTFIANGTHKELLNTSPLYKEIEVTQRNYES